MGNRRTQLLLALFAVAAVAAAVCYGRMTKLRDDAAAAARDLAACRRFASELGPGRESASGPDVRDPATGAAGQPPAAARDPEITRRIREAAAATGVADQLVGVEPGEPRRAPGGGDFDELLVFLRFDAVSLKDLTTFLHHLTAADPSCRSRSIELDAPANAGGAAAAVAGAAPATATTAGEELWSADVTLAYVVRGSGRGPRSP